VKTRRVFQHCPTLRIVLLFLICSFTPPPRFSAFSLVELSIVLVILGLLTGGILAGQSLIRAAELRSISTEYQRYITGLHSFRDRYFALPGDMTNATKFWGIAGGTGTDATCRDTISTDAKTCDGNGDGRVGINSGVTHVNERFRFWQQLANAGLIEGFYTGTGGAVGRQQAVVGENVPVSKMGAGIGWGVKSFDTSAEGGNMMNMGVTSTTNNSLTPLGSLPSEAWNIDTKLDDGMPLTGRVWINPGTAPCVDVSNGYALDYTAKDCSIRFVNIH
jgi:hypothetical protein